MFFFAFKIRNKHQRLIDTNRFALYTVFAVLTGVFFAQIIKGYLHTGPNGKIDHHSISIDNTTTTSIEILSSSSEDDEDDTNNNNNFANGVCRKKYSNQQQHVDYQICDITNENNIEETCQKLTEIIVKKRNEKIEEIF